MLCDRWIRFDVLFEPTPQEPQRSAKTVSPSETYLDVVKADSGPVCFGAVMAECVHDKVGITDIANSVAVWMPKTLGLRDRMAV